MSETDIRNRYGRLCAEIYDLDKPIGSLFDIPYYQGRLKDLDGPVLEAACGTGRLTVPLLEAGLTVDGFDHSPEMLAICAANAGARGFAPRLTQARFQDLDLGRTYGAIIVPASSFILIDDYDEAVGALVRLREHLVPGGLLLLDVPPLSFFEVQARPRSWIAANGDRLTLESHMAVSDSLAQRRVNHDRYERWRDGRLVETELELFAYRVWGVKELELTLAAAGFDQVQVCGNYRLGRPPRAGDGILNFSARRPG